MANLSRFGGVPRSSIFLSEQAAAQADSAGYGQFWVDTDSRPRFTDEAGVDLKLGGGVQRQFLRPGVDLVTGPISIPTYTSGAALATSYWCVNYYTMSATLDKHVYWTVPLPPRWGLGTFRFRFLWAADTTNVGVVRWVVYPMAAAVGDLETPSDTLGTPQVVDDTSSGVVNRVQYSGWTAAVTHGSVANDKLVTFVLMRQGVAAADTFTGAGKLLGVEVEWTSDAPTDD